MKKNFLPQKLHSFCLVLLTGGIMGLCILLICTAALYWESISRKGVEKRITGLETALQRPLLSRLGQFDRPNFTTSDDGVAENDGIISLHIHDGEAAYYATDKISRDARLLAHNTDSQEMTVAALPLFHDNRLVGEARVVIDRHRYRQVLVEKIIALIILGAAASLLSIFICWSLLRNYFLKPFDSIVQKAAAIAHDRGVSPKEEYHIAEFEELSSNLDTIHGLLKDEGRNTRRTVAPDGTDTRQKTRDSDSHCRRRTLRCKNEESFAHLLKNTPDTLYTVNLQSRKYEYISPSCMRTTGYTQEELMELGVNGTSTLLHPQDKQPLRDHFRSCLEKRGEAPFSSSIEYRILHRQLGYRIISDTRTILFDDLQRPLFIIGSARDITEQRTLELEKEKLQVKLRHSQKMEAMGTLMGGIAHDFNNILGAVLGYADVARDSVTPGSPADRDLKEIITAGDRAKELVRQILAYCRQEPHKQIPLCISSVVKESIKLMRASIPANINIQTDIDPLCGNIMGEPTQLHQVVINLFTNAAHAVEDNDEACIRVILCRTTGVDLNGNLAMLSPDASYIELRVEDNGVGMAPEIQERVFDPYFTTKETGKGSGMGLSIVLGIVRSHGGDIIVHSVAGRGTTFSVFFPEIKQKLISGEKKKPQPVYGSGSILLVDDEAPLVRIMSRWLEKLGYRVTSFVDSREALATFRDMPEKFDLVISDQAMPGLTGDRLCREISSVRSDIPIIICTGYSDRQEQLQAARRGGGNILIKPVDKYELMTTVTRCLGEKKGP